VLDTENYRGKREETLKRLADKTAYKVRKSGRPFKLEPMNPYERRVIHSALQGNSTVYTYSEGEEPYRRIVVDIRREK
jgi:spoIIIJ-associated protein